MTAVEKLYQPGPLSGEPIASSSLSDEQVEQWWQSVEAAAESTVPFGMEASQEASTIAADRLKTLGFDEEEQPDLEFPAVIVSEDDRPTRKRPAVSIPAEALPSYLAPGQKAWSFRPDMPARSRSGRNAPAPEIENENHGELRDPWADSPSYGDNPDYAEARQNLSRPNDIRMYPPLRIPRMQGQASPALWFDKFDVDVPHPSDRKMYEEWGMLAAELASQDERWLDELPIDGSPSFSQSGKDRE